MKKIIIIAFVFTMIFTMSACGGKDVNDTSGDDKASVPLTDSIQEEPLEAKYQQDEKPSDNPVALGFENVTDMLTEQERLLAFHFDTLAEDPWLLEAVGSIGATHYFAYSMNLNPDNEDGEFGDIYTMEGLIKKEGSFYSMARSFIADFAYGEVNIGDSMVHRGAAEIADGWIWNESTQKRDGDLIKFGRNVQFFTPEKMVLVAYNLYGTEYDKSDTITHVIRFIISTEESYQYIVASRQYGTDEEIADLGLAKYMTTAEVREILVSNGYSPVYYGKAENGKLTDLLK